MVSGQTAIARADEPPFVAGDLAHIDCAKTHAALDPLTAEERMLWAAETFSERLVLLSSMQKTAVILMHMWKQLGLTNDVLFIDTGYHFVETLRMRDDCMRAWRLNLVTLYPSLTLEDQESQHHAKLFLSNDGQPMCCRLRKEAPLLDYLTTIPLPVVAGGLRRGEGGRRANLQVLSLDLRTAGYQFSPIFDWSNADVDAYTAKHQLPIHPLYQKSYSSIGCYPCTTPVAPGENARAGRWRHLRCAGETDGTHYCGVNFSDGDGI